MALKVLTIKLTDGTSKTYNVPASSSPDQEVLHIKANAGFWANESKRTGGVAEGSVVGDIFFNWEQIVSITYTS
jgi:hypothetical protein